MDRFKIEQEENKMLYAIALRNFTNKTTGKEIKKGDKSGCFNTFETLIQAGTSWIEEGSTALNSRIIGDSFVGEKSTVSHCEIEDTVVLNSDAKFIKIKNEGVSIIENSTISWVTHNNGTLEIKDSKIKGTGIVTKEKVRINKCTISAIQINIQDAALFGVVIKGSDVNITNFNVNNADIGSRVTLYNGNILINDTDPRIRLESKTKTKLFISNGYALKACHIRQIHFGRKNIVVYRHNSGIWCTTHPTRKKENMWFLPDFIPNEVFAKNKPKISGNLFEWGMADDMGNVFDFINDEKELLKEIFPLKAIDEEEETALNEILFLDILSIVLETIDHQDEKMEIEKSIRFNIEKQIIILNDVYLILSDLLVDRIAKITDTSEEYCKNAIETAYGKSKEVKILRIPF